MNILNCTVDKNKFEKAIEFLMDDISFNDNTRLMTSNKTIHELTGTCFYDNRRQAYSGIPFIQNDDLEFGEVVVLTQKM